MRTRSVSNKLQNTILVLYRGVLLLQTRPYFAASEIENCPSSRRDNNIYLKQPVTESSSSCLRKIVILIKTRICFVELCGHVYVLKIQKHCMFADGEARAKSTPLRATGFREPGT